MSDVDAGGMADAARDLLEQGRVAEAQRLYEQLCAAEPANAEAWMMVGAIKMSTGDLAAARPCLDRAVALDPRQAEAHFQLAGLYYAEGNLDSAVASLETAVNLDSDYALGWKMLGDCHLMRGRFEPAEACYRKAAALMPDDLDTQVRLAHVLFQLRRFDAAAEHYRWLIEAQPEAAQSWYGLGAACAAQGQLDAAQAAYRRALELHPDHPESLYGLAFIDYTRRQYPQAADAFRQVLRVNPKHAQALNGLATTLQALGQYQEALAYYDAALKLEPTYADALFGRGSTLIVLGDNEGAIQSLRETLRLNPGHAGACISLASALMTQGRADEALVCCEQALRISPQHADAVALAATIEQHMGKAEQAWQRLQPWVEAGIRNVNLAVAFAEVSKTLDRPGAAIELLERVLVEEQPLPVTSRRNIHFNLGRLYDKIGNYAQAFEHYRQGNAARPMEYDALANSRETSAVIEVHSAAFLAAAPRARERSERPVFVVGMPRSGTSLVEQILASHPKVFGAGELPNLWQMVARLPRMLGTTVAYPGCMTSLQQDTVDRLARDYLDHLAALAPASSRVVDKMPANFWFLGLIALLFPGARVIHCTRDPVDTCLSCYFQDFSRAHAYSYDLAQLGAYYKDYQRLMAHWQQVLSIPMLTVNYEELVENQDAVIRQMVNFIGLDWDDRCLSFHETQRFVATASYDQVRRPLYRKSVARWKSYEAYLGPLVEALK